MPSASPLNTSKCVTDCPSAHRPSNEQTQLTTRARASYSRARFDSFASFDVREREVEIATRLNGPPIPVACVFIEQMPYGEPSANQPAKALIEMNDRVGCRIACVVAVQVENHAARLGRSKPCALERQEAQFVDRIDAPKLAGRLERIDDLRRCLEAYMLGAKVTVTFDDPRFTHARLESPIALGEAALLRRNPLHRIKRQIEFGSTQLALGGPDHVPNAPTIRLLVDRYARI